MVDPKNEPLYSAALVIVDTIEGKYTNAAINAAELGVNFIPDEGGKVAKVVVKHELEHIAESEIAHKAENTVSHSVNHSAGEGVEAGESAAKESKIPNSAENSPVQSANEGEGSSSLLDEKGREHILDGEGNDRGGHRYGTGTPGKTEFPQTWSDGKIEDTLSDIVTDPKTQWGAPDGRGYIKADAHIDGLDIRVIYDTRKGRIVTGYPINTPKNPKP